MNPSDPTFVFSRHEYESYRDFWELVRLSGFKSTPIVEADLSCAGVYICPSLDVEFMKWTASTRKGKRGARVIFWCLERPDAHIPPDGDPIDFFHRGNDEILEMADEIWVSDRGLQRADPRTKFTVMGGHRDLAASVNLSNRINDVAHIGQLTPRRRDILERLRRRSIKVEEGGWDPRRSMWLNHSKILLSLDRFDRMHVSSPLRWAVAAAHRIPIVSERVSDPFPLVDGRSVQMEDLDGIADLVSHLLALESLPVYGMAAWRVFCHEWTFRRGVEEALAASP